MLPRVCSLVEFSLTAPGGERELGRRCSLWEFVHGREQDNTISVGRGEGGRGHNVAYPALTIWAFPGTLSLLPEVTSPTATVLLPSPSQTGHIPTTYLWTQPLLLGRVGLEVLRFPASLMGPLCQLAQACLEVLEVLGKRTRWVSDTHPCWRWEHRKRPEQ